jgi:hypothetical protein
VNVDLIAVDEWRLRTLYQYWIAKRGRRTMPSRADIDPIDLGSLLGNLFLFDVDAMSNEFRFRLAGSNMVETVGVELTGRGLADVGPRYGLKPLLDQCHSVVVSRQPSYLSVLYSAPARRVICRQLLLPLSTNENRVEIILGGVIYSPIAEDRAAGRRVTLNAG